MSNAYVASNKASSTVAANFNATATSITLKTGEGARFPSPTGGDYTLLVLQNSSGVREIVSIVGRTADVLTVGIPGSAAANVAGRNYEAIYGMAAASWVIGDVVSCRPTAGLLEDAVAAGAAASAAQSTANTAVTNAATAQATADAALPKAGGTMTGDLTMGAGKFIVLEGATDDAYETTIRLNDPTADRGIYLPDQDGTVAVQGRGADIASAATINLTTATGDIVDVTGTTAITAVTLADGIQKTVRFTGALTLTNGASLVLPGAANIDTAAGDIAVFRGYASSVVRCVAYQRASGASVVPSVLSKSYDSGNQTVSTGGLLTLAHGLGVKPKVIEFFAKCLTGELGYTAGDEIRMSSATPSYVGSQSGFFGGFVATDDATNVKVRFSNYNGLTALDFSSGAITSLTNANWALVVRAYA